MTALSLDIVRSVVASATSAPSVHNSQPWRFGWDGRALSVFEDPSRALPSLDASGRERLISVGAAVGYARLALVDAGYTCALDLLPDPERPELVATLAPSGEAPAGEHVRDLVAAMSRRYTERGVLDDRPVPDEVVQRLRAAAEFEGAWVRVLDSDDDRVALSVLLSHADAAESSDPDYQAELQRWRTSEPGPEGIPDSAVPDLAPSQRGSDYALRDFDAGRRGDAAPSDDDAPPPRPERPLVVVLGTPHDGRRDWLVAGMALGRLLLQATLDELAASPMTQVVEVESARARLRHDLGIVGVPQVVLRAGYGASGGTTRRRPVDEVLEVVADPASGD